MTKSMTVSIINISQVNIGVIKDRIRRIVKKRVNDIIFVGDGGNNKIYRFLTSNDDWRLAKFYYHHPTDHRERALNEYTAMQYLWNNGIRCIPKPLLYCKQQRCVIFEFIEGKKLCSEDITTKHLYQTIGFLLKLRELSENENSHVIDIATEACFSEQDLIDCIYRRMNRIIQSIQDQNDQMLVNNFILNQIKPSFEKYLKQLDYTQHSHQCASWLHNTISPADIGFHNTLSKNNGELVFLDFEYFGWDDSAKMIADYLLHPGMNLAYEKKSYFLNTILTEWPKGKEISLRLPKIYVLTAFKWCLILLNEFIPEQMKKRIEATKQEFDPDLRKRDQFRKSQLMLKHAKNSIFNFPFAIQYH